VYVSHAVRTLELTNSALVVVLDDLVLGFLSSAPDDESVAGSEDGDSVFADVPEPDVGQSARA
jgi:hypothetical protein